MTPKTDAQSQLEAQGYKVQPAPDKTYAQYRDDQVSEQQKQQTNYPISTFAGEIGGGAASLSALPAAAQGAGFLSRLGRAATVGAGVGLISNPGDKSGEVSPIQPIERLQNAGINAALFPALQAGGEAAGAIGNKLQNAGEELGKYANIKFINAIGGMKGSSKIIPVSELQDFGKKISQEGLTLPNGQFEPLVKAGDSINDIAEKATAIREEVGKNIGSIYENADALDANSKKDNAIDIRRITNDFMTNLQDKYQGKAGSTKILSELQTLADEIAPNGKVGFKDAQSIRQSVDDSVPWNAPAADKSAALEKKALRSQIQDAIKEKLGDLDTEHGTDLVDQFTSQNKRYQTMVRAENLANGKLRGEEFNRSWGLGEQTAAIAGAAAGGTPGAAVAAAVEKAGKHYGNPIRARAAEGVSNFLSTPTGQAFTKTAAYPLQQVGSGISRVLQGN